MRSYHCYFLNARGAIVGRQVMMCLDDKEATEQLSRLMAEPPGRRGEVLGAELWERSRRIALRTADARFA